MYYFLLLAAALMFAAQFVFTKIYGEKVCQKTVQTLIMMIITSIIGAVLYLAAGRFQIRFSLGLTVLAVAFAAVMIPYYILGIKVLSVGSVAVYSMFMMLGGMFLPFVYGVLFLEEPLTLGKGIGCVVLALSIFMQTMVQKNIHSDPDYNRNEKWLFTLLCIAIFVINGLTGIIAKAYQVTEAMPDEVGFTVVSCLFTAVFSALLLIPHWIGNKEALKAEVKAAFKPALLLCMSLIGVTTHTGNFMHLKAAAQLPASVQFPMVSGGVIVFSAIASVLIFKEKISKTEMLCVAGACLSTVMFVF